MNTVLFVNATIGFSKNVFVVLCALVFFLVQKHIRVILTTCVSKGDCGSLLYRSQIQGNILFLRNVLNYMTEINF